MSDLANYLMDSFSKEKVNSYTKIDRKKVIKFYKKILEILFYNYYHENIEKEELEKLIDESKQDLLDSVKILNLKLDIDKIYGELIEVKRLLETDIEAIYEGDPACNSYMEVILTYPGFLAISAYRISHVLYKNGYKFLARIISEYAHSRTGIDINPGAQIGESFFIDHGTGIVIGETSVIGKNCKIYQGVTIGALSLKDGRNLEGKKRHPTILDNVTIYSGASILGGNTIIGNNVTIGSNAFVLKSIEEDSLVKIKLCEDEIIKKR